MNAVDKLDDEHFDAEAKDFSKSSFLKTNELLLAASLYRYSLDSRCKIRNHMLPLFPKDLVKMKSGHGFHKTCNKVYVTAYRHEMASVQKRVHSDTQSRKLPRCFHLQFGSTQKPHGTSALSTKSFVVLIRNML